MNRYTLYCTMTQTKKAFELGAPIKEAMSRYNAKVAYNSIINGKETEYEYLKQGIAIVGNKISARAYNIPTAEQMIGWLEEQGLSIDVFMYKFVFSEEFSWTLKVSDEYKNITILLSHNNDSRKEATLAAIDEALEYLSKK